jgi:Spy/CpxP family protein refolding chaperone
MARQLALTVVAALLWASAAGAAEVCAGQHEQQKPAEQPQAKQDGPPRWKWWLNPDSRKEFGITDQQSKLVDQVWQQYAPTQRQNWQTLEQEEAVLAQMIKDSTATVPAVKAQVEKVEKLRADVNATRTVMLYRMMLVLTPEQRTKVKAMHDAREAARRKQGDKGERKP